MLTQAPEPLPEEVLLTQGRCGWEEKGSAPRRMGPLSADSPLPTHSFVSTPATISCPPGIGARLS